MRVPCPRCETEIEVRIYQDSDGDHTIPYGVRTWWDGEIIEQPCACELTAVEYDAVIEAAIDAARDYDPANDIELGDS